MLTQTTLTAIRTLIHLGLAERRGPVSLQQVAQNLDVSPTYLAQVARNLAKAGILRVYRGALGGVELYREPQAITLLSIVEATQGVVIANYCQDTADTRGTCAFHQAAAELQAAIVGVLSRWTLADLLRTPAPSLVRRGPFACVLRAAGGTKSVRARSGRGLRRRS